MQRMRQLENHRLHENEFEQTPGDSGGQRNLCVTVHGTANSWT